MCATCGHTMAARVIPTACFRCGARLGRGAPCATARLVVDGARDGLRGRLAWRRVGEWSVAQIDAFDRGLGAEPKR